ncbi:MAG: thiopeptide-type bacteriocin biosynthesis protein [Pseudonocardiaceae bacterium]
MPSDQLTIDGSGDSHPQIVVEFTGWDTAETATARHVHPVLARTARWWFVRKHPCWRFRSDLAGSPDPDVAHELVSALDGLVDAGTIRRWHHSVYEPETRAFGGPAGMRLAHELFRHDSSAVLDTLHQAPAALPGRRELTVLAISVLLRAARQDWFEQGDLWARVADLRRSDQQPPAVSARAGAAIHHLMTADAGPGSALLASGPLAPLSSWLAAFDHAGRELAQLRDRGELRRGIRAVLAHHVIFHWNRLGIPYTDQLALARLARDVVLHPERLGT